MPAALLPRKTEEERSMDKVEQEAYAFMQMNVAEKQMYVAEKQMYVEGQSKIILNFLERHDEDIEHEMI